MQKQYYYQLQWPKDNLFISCYVHELYNYRYHWHDSDYEIDILLNGKAEFCSGQNTYYLEEDDVILINPGTWHASFSREENSRALVLRFSESAFKTFLKRDEQFCFLLPPSDEKTRNNRPYKKLRYYAALLLSSIEQEEPFQKFNSKAAIEMILSTVCQSGYRIEKVTEPNQKTRQIVERIVQFMGQHYTEKLSLDDVGQYAHYNRTYVSTLFKNTMGINFHDYLTRLRLSNAIFQLAVTDKNITQIAIDCGFSDLKTFNHRFRDIFGYLPTEYRQRLNPECIMHLWEHQVYISPENPKIANKLNEFLSIL